MMTNRRFVRLFEELGMRDVALVGGKNASLGEMYRKLTRRGVRVPNGFAVTTEAYRYVLERGGCSATVSRAATEAWRST
jgi:pyruvate,water dikinase